MSWVCRTIPRLKRVAVVASTTLAVCVLLTACGGSGSRINEQAATETSAEQEAEAKTAAFARCMREQGVDVNASGALVVDGRSAARPGTSAFEEAQAKCEKFQPNVGVLSGPPPSAETLDKLVKIASCMRRHGISEFPDPTTRRPSPSSLSPRKYPEITNYDGAVLLFPRTIDLEAPAYRRALTACGAPPLGLPH